MAHFSHQRAVLPCLGSKEGTDLGERILLRLKRQLINLGSCVRESLEPFDERPVRAAVGFECARNARRNISGEG
jgi:hypothetical protein